MESKYIILIIGGTIILSVLSVLIIAFIFIYQKRYHKYVKEKEEMQLQFSQLLLQSQIEIQHQTLQNLSYEVHDNIGQIVSLIKINLNTLNINDVEKATEKISDTKLLVKQLIQDVKSLSVSLGSDRIAKIGIVKAIEIEVERLNKTGQFFAELINDDDPPALSKEISILLFRMTQEILNNVVKHSSAKHISITINKTLHSLILIFKDDGIGFNLKEKMDNPNEGAGLSNLKNRAKFLNAHLDIKTALKIGTTISIEMPI